MIHLRLVCPDCGTIFIDGDLPAITQRCDECLALFAATGQEQATQREKLRRFLAWVQLQNDRMWARLARRQRRAVPT